MKTKLLSLLLACLMLCLPFCLSACSGDKEAEVVDMSERDEIYLTLYTVTDKKTTEEGILRAQEAMDKILFDRYKTHIVLKCFTADEYQAELDSLYAKFDEQKEEERKAEEEEKQAEKERQAAEKDLTKAEKRKLEEERSKAKAEEEAKAAEEEEARLERIRNGEESPVLDPQLDILYLPDAESYYNAVSEELLLPLDDYLKVDYKELYDYIHPNLLTTAKLSYDEEDAALYGIPNNTAVSGEGWYYVINTALAEKHGLDLTVYPPTLGTFAEYLAVIKANEPDVIPLANPGPANGVDFYNDIEGFPIAVSNPEYGVFEARGAMQTYAPTSNLREHFKYMADFRAAGYFADREMTSADNYFMDIRKGSEADVKAWEDAGYTVLTYRRPTTSIAECRSGFYGISAYCAEDYQPRAMEVLLALNTNPALHNIFAFGVEGEDYELNDDGITVHKLNDDYTMNFADTGNTLLGYLPEGYSPDYIETIRSINRASKLSGFSAFFLSMDEDEAEWYADVAQYRAECAEAYRKLCAGTPDWEAICNDLHAKLDAVDLSGFLTDVFNPKYRSAAKAVRSADGDNYTSDPIYFQSQYEELLAGGMIAADDAAGDTPAPDAAGDTPAPAQN